MPFDATKQNALYASLDLIGLNSDAAVGWVEILSISEGGLWRPPRGHIGVANITLRTMRDRVGPSMGEVCFQAMSNHLLFTSNVPEHNKGWLSACTGFSFKSDLHPSFSFKGNIHRRSNSPRIFSSPELSLRISRAHFPKRVSPYFCYRIQIFMSALTSAGYFCACFWASAESCSKIYYQELVWPLASLD